MQTNKHLVFTGFDLARSRMLVEREKLDLAFPQFRMYGTNDRITAIRGRLYTNSFNLYDIRIEIPSGYPYKMPIIKLPYHEIESTCPHVYNRTGKSICVMRSSQWSSTYSLAFVVAKAAVWLNKYDVWKRSGKWPGKEQKH